MHTKWHYCNVFELFVRNISKQKLYPQFLISLDITHTKKKQQTATNVWWIPKIYTWNFVVNCLYPNNNGMLSTRGTTWRITWHKCKGLSFQRQGVSTLNCSKMQTQGCPISNAQLLNKGRYMPTVRIIMTSTNGRSGKFASFRKLHAGE